MDEKPIKDDEQIKKEMIDLLMEKITGGIDNQLITSRVILKPRSYVTHHIFVASSFPQFAFEI